MRIYSICIILLLTCSLEAADMPDSILGTWQLDLQRAQEDAFHRIAILTEAHTSRMENRPPLPGPIRRFRANKAKKPFADKMKDTEVRIKFTDDRMINYFDGVEISGSAYEIIGRGVDFVVIKISDQAGYVYGTRIFFVESGIALRSLQVSELVDYGLQEAALPPKATLGLLSRGPGGPIPMQSSTSNTIRRRVDDTEMRVYYTRIESTD